MPKNLKKFGEQLKKIRIASNLSLREMCKKVDYDPSNWSKIERGIISPPADIATLSKWAKALGLNKNPKEFQGFMDNAQIAQGIIPKDILSRKNAVDYLPAVFRTLRNEKPTKKEIEKLLKLIKKSEK